MKKLKGSIFVRNQIGTPRYNGVPLPPLPEWDREKYPYAFINGTALFLFKIAPMYGTYSTSGGTYTKPYIRVPAGEVTQYYYYSSTAASDYNGNWKLNGPYTVDCTTSGDYYLRLDQLVWTNTDIPNVDDGTTYLAASDPVFVTNLTGRIIHRKLRGGVEHVSVPPERIPVAYLYNGVELPELPEWDREKYPYVYITETTKSLIDSSNGYHVWYCNNPVHAKLSNGKYYFNSNGVGITYYRRKYSDGKWGKNLGVVNNMALSQISHPIWSNTDMYTLVENADTGELEMTDTIAIAASDPIPVYDTDKGVESLELLAPTSIVLAETDDGIIGAISLYEFNTELFATVVDNVEPVTVKFGGVDYSTTFFREESTGWTVGGNLGLAGMGDDTGEPFFFLGTDEDPYNLTVLGTVAGTYTIAMYVERENT